jgi:hypothetical protein
VEAHQLLPHQHLQVQVLVQVQVRQELVLVLMRQELVSSYPREARSAPTSSSSILLWTAGIVALLQQQLRLSIY